MSQQIIARFHDLQRTIDRRNGTEATDAFIERVYCSKVEGLYFVGYYGLSCSESYFDFLNMLRMPEIASRLKAVELRGPDEGANGTRNWDLGPLLQSAIVFPQLTSFFIEPTAPEHHNATIVAEEYDEAGVQARLLASAPTLNTLTTPSAPDASFFEVGIRPLGYLRVDVGYDSQNFILNLSKSNCFPELRYLEYGDYNERYMEDYPKGCTPCEHYRAFLQSPASAALTTLVLRNSICTSEELVELHALREQVTIRVVQSYGDYVS